MKSSFIERILILFAVGYSIFYAKMNFEKEGFIVILKCIGTILILLAPYIIEKGLKKELSPMTKKMYVFFVFLAYFIGNVVGGYKVPYFDKITHLISGIVTSFIGIYFLAKFDKFDKKPSFDLIFILFTVLAIAAFWEIFEYTGDCLFHSNMQRLETGVNDTMRDMIMAFSGYLLFVCAYFFEKSSHTKFIITKFIEEAKEYYGPKKER